MAHRASRMTPPTELLFGAREMTRSRELLGAPRAQGRGYLDTPKSARNRTQSAGPDDRIPRRISLNFSPSSRGSPMLSARSQSPSHESPQKLSPFSDSLLSRQKQMCPGSGPLLPRRSPKSPRNYAGDRFIPSRSAMDMTRSNFVLTNSNTSRTPSQNRQIPVIKVLDFGKDSPNCQKRREFTPKMTEINRRQLKVSSSPERVLDAPGVLVSSAMHLLDWNTQSILALALDDSVYLWDSRTCKTVMLCKSDPQACITAVRWRQDGQVLAVASSDGRINCWVQDSGNVIVLRRACRITSLAWNQDELACGDMAGNIRRFDIMTYQGDGTPGIFLEGHSSVVTSLAWNRTGTLLGSGSQDGEVKIWSKEDFKPLHTLQGNMTGVSICEWSPSWNSVLAVGNSAGHIIVWRTSKNPVLLTDVDTGSPVTDIKWHPITTGIFSSHDSSCINYWTFPQMKNTRRYMGHDGRILNLAFSPDFRSLMSLGADETLRIWRTPEQEETKNSLSPSPLNSFSLR